MLSTRVKLSGAALCAGALCVLALSLLAAPGPADSADIKPSVPHAIGRTEITCPYVGSNRDDMLVHPGMPGMAHEHDYYGARGVTASTTVDTIRGHGTSCPDADDESGYWAPSLQIGGTTYRPTAAHIYYERNTTRPVTAFPAGFHTVVGDMMITSDGTSNPHIFFGCAGSEDNRATTVTVSSCKKGSKNTFAIWLEYPNCWDGKAASGPSMNLVYRTGKSAQCPSDHPVLLPTLRTTLWYDLPTSLKIKDPRLASGPMGSAHGDFVNGWAPATMSAIVKCINSDNRNCPN